MPDRRRGWRAPALALTLAVTALRVVGLWLDQKQLFVDEAQYWLWGQDLAWGYYSKPPLVGWVIRAVTDLAGSDAPFWVRLPAPLLHGVTAMALGALAARLFAARAALWTVALYLTMPLIAVGSQLMTTDTVMFPFLVLALLAWLAAIDRRQARWGALAGVALGLGFLAKYAAVYYLLCAALAAWAVPVLRPRRGAAGAGLAAFAVVIAPNVLWNLANGGVTVEHTIGHVALAGETAPRLTLNWAELGAFLAAQLAAFGPVFFVALVGLGASWGRRSPEMRLLLVLSLPIVALIVVQAALSGAYANWAAPAYLAGTVAVAAALAARARAWLVAGLAINLALSLFVGLVPLVPDYLPESVRAATMDRYLGRVELTEAIVATAREERLDTVVSDNRDVLADLFYSGRNSGLTVRAVPPDGPPANHYAMSFPFAGGEAPVLYVGGRGDPPACLEAPEPVTVLAPPGYWADRPRALWVVPGDCWES